MRRYTLILSVCIILFGGCVEDFDLKLSNAESRLVVQGLITNKSGPYYVRLTKSKSGAFTSPYYSYIDNAEIIKDATVVISDGSLIDTLKLVKSETFDAVLHEGDYKTTSLKGIPGHNYLLKIKVWGKEFEATSYMPSVPEIDSLDYLLKTSEKDGQKYYVPLLNFKEPQGINNYYLIQLNDEFSTNIQTHNVWQFSILSDHYLNPYVSNLNISTGANPRGIEYPVYWEGDQIYVALSSLTKEDYDYYKVLLDQFDNDGGAYKPSPSSPPGNINNGGLGLFRASAVSEKRIQIPKSSTK